MLTKREKVAQRDDGWYCHYCHQALANVDAGQPGRCVGTQQGHTHPTGLCWPQLDHVVAQANGGGDRVENLVLSCFLCNNAKRALTYLEFITGWRQVVR